MVSVRRVRVVAVTGMKGVIGQVITGSLSGWEMRCVDLPECDVRDYDQLLAALSGADAVIHLEWDTRENFLSGRVEPDNQLMTHNVYAAARAAGVARVVAASSVHADRFWPGAMVCDGSMICRFPTALMARARSLARRLAVTPRIWAPRWYACALVASTALIAFPVRTPNAPSGSASATAAR